ncbi:Histone [Taenia solium]|eukprot:TsM_001019900 transcript=TsM_001019900 gene=TsM_001019900
MFAVLISLPRVSSKANFMGEHPIRMRSRRQENMHWCSDKQVRQEDVEDEGGMIPKKKKRRTNLGYATRIDEVLHEVHPDAGNSWKAKLYKYSFLNDTVEQFATKSIRVTNYSNWTIARGAYLQLLGELTVQISYRAGLSKYFSSLHSSYSNVSSAHSEKCSSLSSLLCSKQGILFHTSFR